MTKKIISIILSFIFIITLIPALSIPSSAEEADGAGTQEEKIVTFEEIVSASATIVRQNEGSYASVNRDDNGALSIGWIQWHANRALNLLKTIVAGDEAKAKELLGGELYNEIKTASSWTTRILTVDEAARVSALISTDIGKKAQDDLAANDLSSYINRAVGYGITDPAALVYYSDIENQCGSGGAKRVAAAAKEIAGSYGAITLDIIHEAALADSIAGKYASRRQKTYNNCILLNWDTTVISGEVWIANVNLNIRKEPGIQGELLTSVAKGMCVVIKEKAAVGTATWGRTSMGWLSLDYCTINEEYKSTAVPAPIVFDTAGGFLPDATPVTSAVNYYNAPRPANSLVVYDNDYELSYAPTNVYGGECAVDSTGKVLFTPKSGIAKTTIPEGGFVLSAHGTMLKWLTSNVSEGNYVIFDKETKTVKVYKDEASLIIASASTSYGERIGALPTPKMEGNSFTGWLDTEGNLVSSETVCETHLCMVLKASWTVAIGNRLVFDPAGGTIEGTLLAAVDGVDCYRDSNDLVLYKAGSSTGTNKYGNEAIVGADGKVISVTGSGIGNSEIPEGGFVLSGHGTMDKWISDNLSEGMIVIFNEYRSTVTVYKSEEVYNFINRAVPSGEAIGTLPSVSREYYEFLGWFTPAGDPITKDTLMGDEGVIVMAQWRVLPGKLSFDTLGGTLSTASVSFACSGVDVHRAANSLVIYRTRQTTQTNAYGTEVLVGNDGIVDIVYPYGVGNCTVQKNTFVISGNGAASTWIKENIKPGNYVETDNKKITVWADYESYLASGNTTVLYDKEYGSLPYAYKEGYAFLGWQDENKNTVTSESTVEILGDVVLYASFEKLARVTFDNNGGETAPYSAKTAANGINVARGGNSLIIYAGKASTGTNAYGVEALIAPDGRVTAIYDVGKGNNSIPDGYIILSGHGTKGSWIKSCLKVGKYVKVSGYNVFVYDSPALMSYANNSVYVKKDTSLGALPVGIVSESTLVGWLYGDTEFTGNTTVTEDMIVRARWTRSSATVIFDLAGGIFAGPSAKAAATARNTARPANSLIIFDSDYSRAQTATNAYGGEIAVDASGRVTSNLVFGTCKTTIPEGGFVLSAHGTMYSWLSVNVKEGYYVSYDKETLEIKVYKTYGDFTAKTDKTIYCNQPYGSLPTPTHPNGISVFLGWKNSEGVLVNEKTVVANCDDPVLTAVWTKNAEVTFDTNGGTLVMGSTALTGTNVARPTNGIILYENKQSTGTNVYGSEAIINGEGKVTTLYSYGSGNHKIPNGCFALSGNGTMSTWIQTNLKVGNYVMISENNIIVFDSKISMDAYDGTVNVPEGAVIGSVPTPKRYGYTFDGWFANGYRLTADTVISEDSSYSAHWTAKKIKVEFDAAGGSFPTPAIEDVTGINVQRFTNALVIYDGSDGRITTGTNIYGTEAVVDKNGIVTSIKYYGSNNAEIPDGGFVLSAHGTASVWLKENVKVGNYVVYDGSRAVVYTDPAAVFASEGKLITFNTPYGALPTPVCEGKTFEGWFTADGTHVTEDALLLHEGEPLKLIARWK